MAYQEINIGSGPNTGDGDKGRVGAQKINDNFVELYAIKAQISYTQITTATYAISEAQLVVGHNIFGVDYAGNVSITIPASIDQDKLIIINDESGMAGTYNITITVA